MWKIQITFMKPSQGQFYKVWVMKEIHTTGGGKV